LIITSYYGGFLRGNTDENGGCPERTFSGIEDYLEKDGDLFLNRKRKKGRKRMYVRTKIKGIRIK
jgi:hypothetical protein